MTELEHFKCELLAQKYVLPKHFGFSTRMVSYWKSKKVLPFFQKDQHGRMNVPQAVWLHLVNELSEVGINTKRLSQLAYSIWQRPIEEGFFDRKLNTAIVEEEKKISPDKRRIQGLTHILNDPILKPTLAQEQNPFLDPIVDSILVSNKPISFYYLPKQDEWFISDGIKALTEKSLSYITGETYICIPLLPFISQIVSVEFDLIDEDIPYLNSIENKLRDIVKTRSPKFIDIIIDNNKLQPLIIREQHKSARALSEFILANKFPKTGRIVLEKRSQDNYKLTVITK